MEGVHTRQTLGFLVCPNTPIKRPNSSTKRCSDDERVKQQHRDLDSGLPMAKLPKQMTHSCSPLPRSKATSLSLSLQPSSRWSSSEACRMLVYPRKHQQRGLPAPLDGQRGGPFGAARPARSSQGSGRGESFWGATGCHADVGLRRRSERRCASRACSRSCSSDAPLLHFRRQPQETVTQRNEAKKELKSIAVHAGERVWQSMPELMRSGGRLRCARPWGACTHGSAGSLAAR